jgi:hypothetical protein
MPTLILYPRLFHLRSLPAPTASHRLRQDPFRHLKNHRPRSIQARFRPHRIAQPNRLRAPEPELPAQTPFTTPTAQPSAKKQNA